MKVIYLEDDPAQAEMVTMWLDEAGIQVDHFGTGKAFLSALQRDTYDVVILDWELPDMVGDEILTTVRETLQMEIPAICTTVRDQEDNIVRALKLGADDYMTKPVKKLELLARLDSLLRRTRRDFGSSSVFEYAPFRFDSDARRLTKDEESIVVTDKEFMLARLLFQNIGRMLSRNFLLETVWGTRGDLDTRTVDTHISRVRRKLGLNPDEGWRLKPVYKFGYRLERLHSSSE